MNIKAGDRVGAILSGKDGKVESLGYGTYTGQLVPPDRGPRSLATILHEANVENIRILLDSGKEVFGCECWWGPENVMRERLDVWRAKGWEIIEVDIDDVLWSPPEVKP
jgi:hypothetical protein